MCKDLYKGLRYNVTLFKSLKTRRYQVSINFEARLIPPGQKPFIYLKLISIVIFGCEKI